MFPLTGGWWEVSRFEDIKGDIAIEMGPNMYMYALDNGLFRLGPPHKTGTKHNVYIAKNMPFMEPKSWMSNWGHVTSVSETLIKKAMPLVSWM